MKTKVKILLTVLITALAINVSAQQRPGKQNFIVLGNCGMCEKTIEKAALTSGATKAEWNKETKVLVVQFNPKKVSSDEILKSIANAGYDNEKFLAATEAYNNLHECCKYDRYKKKEKTK